MTNDDALDGRLRDWAAVPLPPALAARTRARARAVLQAEGRGPVRRAASFAGTAAVVSAVAIYFAWIVQFLNALARG